jgi:hypothetical protein
VRPYLKKTQLKKKVHGVDQGVGPEFKFQHPRTAKKKRERRKQTQDTEVTIHCEKRYSVFVFMRCY